MDKKAKRPGTALVDPGLTIGECLMLYRKEHRLNQSEMANKMRLTYDIYRTWEYDMQKPTKPIPSEFLKSWDFLKITEKCLIFRRRAKIPQKQIAREVGVSRFWLGKMERGEVDSTKLVAYWESYAGRILKKITS